MSCLFTPGFHCLLLFFQILFHLLFLLFLLLLPLLLLHLLLLRLLLLSLVFLLLLLPLDYSSSYSPTTSTPPIPPIFPTRSALFFLFLFLSSLLFLYSSLLPISRSPSSLSILLSCSYSSLCLPVLSLLPSPRIPCIFSSILIPHHFSSYSFACAAAAACSTPPSSSSSSFSAFSSLPSIADTVS